VVVRNVNSGYFAASRKSGRAQVDVALGHAGIDVAGRDQRFDGLQLSVLLVSIVPRTYVKWPSIVEMLTYRTTNSTLLRAVSIVHFTC